jgi:hypothetical protein
MKSIISSDRRNMDLLTLQIVPVVEEVVIAPAIVDESLESITIEPAQTEETTTDTSAE